MSSKQGDGQGRNRSGDEGGHERRWKVVGEKNREISGGVTDENGIGGS